MKNLKNAETKIVTDKLNEIIQLLKTSNENSKEILTTEQAADYLNVSTKTLLTYCRSGRLKFGQPNRKYMFRKADLEEFIVNLQNSFSHE